MIPQRPQKYWDKKTAAVMAANMLPYSPGVHSVYGYRLGRLRGMNRKQSVLLGAKKEGISRASEIAGHIVGMAPFAKGLIRNRKEIISTIKTSAQTALHGAGSPPMRLAKAAIAGTKAAALQPNTRNAFIGSTIGGWAGYLAPGLRYRKEWRNANAASRRYWNK